MIPFCWLTGGGYQVKLSVVDDIELCIGFWGVPVGATLKINYLLCSLKLIPAWCVITVIGLV